MRLRLLGVGLLAALAACTSNAMNASDGGSDIATARDGVVGDTGGGDVLQVVDGGSGRSFCDPGTWGGTAPGPTTDVRIPSGEVVIDCEVEVRSLEIAPGATLRASRTRSSRLTLHGNLVVLGRLDYGTADDRVAAGTTAEIVFQGMNDEDYVGTFMTAPDSPEFSNALRTPMAVLASDVGLWVMGDGVFTAAGQLKRAWSRLTEGAAPGDARFGVENADGWQPGDRVALTPTAAMSTETDFVDQFDEGTLAAVDGTTATLAAPPAFVHAGCTDAACFRRGEAVNLTRNVVVRSFDDTAHAHIMVAERARAQLDSVELRWLGPERTVRCGGPQRRAPLWFHQQEDASRGSFVRHVSIWGGQQRFLMIERSHGIDVTDVAGYDTYGNGFEMSYEGLGCGTRCSDRGTSAPRDSVFTDVLSARVGAAAREEGCLRIEYRLAGINLGGGERSGCVRCVATGIGRDASGEDIGGFGWQETGTGRPLEFAFRDSVSHNNNGHGLFVWHNSNEQQAPYTNIQVWSNARYGIHWGAYGNAYLFQNLLMVDNGLASLGIKAIPSDPRQRIDSATIDDVRVLAYVFVQERANILRNLTFTGARPVGVTQLDNTCETGNPDDPNDPSCVRVWLRFENPVFPAGMVPFRFGNSLNRHAVWEVRGFQSPDYPDLPRDFDLHRRDSNVTGGRLYPAFDAWLVPR